MTLITTSTIFLTIYINLFVFEKCSKHTFLSFINALYLMLSQSEIVISSRNRSITYKVLQVI
jgi:hypothetical protein